MDFMTVFEENSGEMAFKTHKIYAGSFTLCRSRGYSSPFSLNLYADLPLPQVLDR